MRDAAKGELLRALGELVRGLSILFWGLGIIGFICLEMARAQTDKTAWTELFGRLAFAPMLMSCGMIWAGLRLMRPFQPQERIWQRALDRAEALVVTVAGLAPFLFAWHQFPAVRLFASAAGLSFLCTLLLLAQINSVLRRLSAMLPEETLRGEAKLCTTCNLAFLFAEIAGIGGYFLLSKWTGVTTLPFAWAEAFRGGGIWVPLLLAILPLVMTMALAWKIKDVIFSSLLEGGG